MQNAFILNGKIHSFKKADIGVYIEACKVLDVDFFELTNYISSGNLEASVVLMYCSLRDKKDLTLEDMKSIDIEMFNLLSTLWVEVNK